MWSRPTELTDYAVDSMNQPDAAMSFCGSKLRNHLLALLLVVIATACGWGLC